jgi:probable F420-dependent oxidoreductase
MAVEMSPVGIWTSSRQWSGIDPVAVVAELEELGYGALWIGSAAPDLALPETLLAASNRLVVVTGIVSVWVTTAGELATRHAELTTAHPDRFLLGLGAGHEKFVGPAYAKPYTKVADFLNELDAATPPVPADERLLAALGPRMLALAGQRTRGAHPYLTTPEHTSDARKLLGPDPLLAPEQKVILETDPTRARTVARQALALYLGLPNYLRSFTRLGFGADDFTGGGSDRLIDTLVAWGDLDTIAARVAEHRQAGADQVTVQVLPADGGTELPRREWRELAPALLAG